MQHCKSTKRSERRVFIPTTYIREATRMLTYTCTTERSTIQAHNDGGQDRFRTTNARQRITFSQQVSDFRGGHVREVLPAMGLQTSRRLGKISINKVRGVSTRNRPNAEKQMCRRRETTRTERNLEVPTKAALRPMWCHHTEKTHPNTWRDKRKHFPRFV